MACVLLRFLTDLELACKTKAFDVHKLVISSVSQYFREVLAKDPGMKRLELPSLSPLGAWLHVRSKVTVLCVKESFLRHRVALYKHERSFVSLWLKLSNQK